jgi:Protein of unknown function (DUF3891)
MIVRERPGSYVLIKQHDHGLVSGEFARHWAEEPQPLEPTLYAIANHDVGWQGPDAFVLWNEESGKPYSFTSYPVEPKLRAYKAGLDFLEARSPYAACLCSMHYATLVGGSEEEATFRESEAGRQRKIKNVMNEEESDNLEHNFRLLRLFDNLSLFVCLNEPGRNDHPWYENGFSFEGSKLEPVWEDSSTLRLDPNPFSEPFDLIVPYALIEKSDRPIESNRLELRVTC